MERLRETVELRRQKYCLGRFYVCLVANGWTLSEIGGLRGVGKERARQMIAWGKSSHWAHHAIRSAFGASE